MSDYLSYDAIAKIGDNITGKCFGSYQSYEAVGSDDEGNTTYGWVTHSESGYVTGYIETGSPITFDQGKAIARVGDRVRIYKHYSHSYHSDSLEITGTVTSGSNILYDQGKPVAKNGSTVSASGCSDVKIIASSNILFAAY